MTAVAILENVSKHFGRVEAVKGVSFTLRAGETVALVGHNGAGKSTLMKLMLGLVRPTAGTVRVLGDDPAQGDFAGRLGLGFLPEHVAFNGALTGRETLRFYARLKRQSARRIDELLEKVGMAHAADRRVGEYSNGMRQRLGLAQALLGQLRLLLLDEPTTGLDPELRQTFYGIIETLRSEGVAILLSSHALEELEGRTNRVIVMNRGIKRADGTISELQHIAHLPTRIVVRLGEGVAAERSGVFASGRRIDAERLEFSVAAGDKMAMLRQLTASDVTVADIDVIPPTLDELYAHFLSTDAGAAP